jgi:hypothetical protein
MFTLDMFDDTQLGALDAARYYIDAENWSTASMNGSADLAICDDKRCHSNAVATNSLAKTGRHVVGQRITTDAPTLLPAPSVSTADWVVQVKEVLAPGKLVDGSGKTLNSAGKSTRLLNLYMKWNGKMWRVIQIALAG